MFTPISALPLGNILQTKQGGGSRPRSQIAKLREGGFAHLMPSKRRTK